ncbi:MAG: hypothetical protein WA789_10020 [Candidatus Acidiferrum sp.]
MAFSPVESVKGELKSIRSSYFVKYSEQIVPDSVLTEFQFLRNVTISHTFGYQVDNAFFPLCKQARSSHRDRPRRRTRPQRFDHEAQFLAARPHLPLVHCVDALAQQFRRLIAGKYAAGSCSECFDHHGRFIRIEYYDDTRLGTRSHYLSRYIKTSQCFFLKTSTDDGNIGVVRLESFANPGSVRRVSNNPGPVPSPPHGSRYQLATQLTAVGDKDLHRAATPWGFRQLFAPKSYLRGSDMPTPFRLVERLTIFFVPKCRKSDDPPG